MIVREAVVADIPAMSRVLTRSIIELCAADHRNDPEIIAGWTRNKSEDGVRAMLEAPSNIMLVVVDGETVLAVGGIIAGNQISLNYVDPGHRFRGASTLLLEAIEHRIREAGHSEAELRSTETARRFYLARGWQETGPGAPRAGYPMRKVLGLR